jgi:hypothetical protein
MSVSSDQKPACGRCAFAALEVMQGQLQRVLVCHRMPPAVCMVTMPNGRGIQGMTMFPTVQPQMYCHEFKVKDEVSATVIEGSASTPPY